MKTIDFGQQFKELYTAKTTAQEVVAAAGVFLAVEGRGKPGGEEFQAAIQQLYTAAYTLKFAGRGQGRSDFKVGKLECLYFSDPQKTPMDQWQWRFLLRIPDDVSAKDLALVKKAVREKKGLDLAAVKRVRWKEGRAMQLLHVGPYDQVGQTYCRLHGAAAERGLKLAGAAHEIYLNDPRRAAREKLKTIVRMAARK